MVDIDKFELQKPTFKADVPVWGDVKEFLELLEIELPYKEKCADWLS